MRPINLIPKEERRGERGKARSGALPYVLLGALGCVLVATIALVVTAKQIDERKTEVSQLEIRAADAVVRADALQPYADFAALAASRDQTVNQLATSRFDWERVLNELALVIPDNAWLTQVTGTVAPGVTVEGGGAVATRAGVAGPALELIGCAASQEAVAELTSALRDIDGVTRVGLDSSELGDSESAGAEGAEADASSDCRTREFIAQFQLVIAFDGAPVVGAPIATTPPPPSEPAATAEPAATTGTEQPPPEGDPADAESGGQTASAPTAVTGAAR